MKSFTSAISILVLSIMMALTGCKSNKETASSASAATEQSSESPATETPSTASAKLVSIKRTACYGRCPIYQLTIMDNGELLYEGKRFVEKIGTYTGLITGQDLENVIKKINEVKYFELEDAYDVPIADFPTCVTSVNLDGKSKTIMNKQGAPAELKSLELYIDSLIDGLEMKRLSDEVNY